MMGSGENTKGVSAFAEDFRSMTHGSNQLPQQKPGIEVQLSRKDVWRTFLLMVWTPVNDTGN